MTSDNLLEKLEEQLFSNPRIVDALLDDVMELDRTGTNIFTPSAMVALPSLKSAVQSMICDLDENIRELSSVLCEFPPEDFSPCSLDVERVKTLFSKCHAVADDMAFALGPIYKMVLAASDVDDRNVIHGLGLEKPASVYEYPKWLSDCAIVGDMALDIIDSRSEMFVSDSLDTGLQINPINIRMLRCLDDRDPLSKALYFSKKLERFGQIDLIVEDGHFSLSSEWFEDIDPLVCFPSTDDPVLILSTVDNFAQMLGSYYGIKDEGLLWFCNGIETLERTYVIRDSSKSIHIPKEMLESSGIPFEGEVPCKVLCYKGKFELWESDSLDAVLERVDLSKLFA